MHKTHLLLIEDDAALADGLARTLGQDGYRVTVRATLQDGLATVEAQAFEVLILDLGLPDGDGRAVLDRLRELACETPVLVLSARDAVDERVQVLDLGADDYVVKPAAVEEIRARVRAMLRRRRARAGETVTLGRLTLDSRARRAYIDAQPLTLTARELAALEFLAVRSDRIVTKEDLLSSLYGGDRDVSENAVEKLMSRIRARVEPAGVRLRVVRGLGYYLQAGDA
ncbi:MAG TPA: response regulator transcription factor [Rhodocyclaceae bacterium]|nr:response regulator transcription factor [Rhodocyclaceae bacterium]HNH34853.1 response regulator transcription factor [Rhodocyclaceae bacterium]